MADINELLDKLFEALNNPQLEALGADMMLETADHFHNGRVVPGVVTRFVGLLAAMELERRTTAEGTGGRMVN